MNKRIEKVKKLIVLIILLIAILKISELTNINNFETYNIKKKQYYSSYEIIDMNYIENNNIINNIELNSSDGINYKENKILTYGIKISGSIIILI